MTEFNLSEEIDDFYGVEAIETWKIKEFIKRLKEFTDIDRHCECCDRWKKHINKLAGDKLIDNERRIEKT